MHNLGTIIQFEVVRTLKKKSFWLTALAFPLSLVVIFAIIFFANKATSDSIDKLKEESFSMRITDNASVLDKDIVSALKANMTTDKDASIADVKAGKLDAYVYIPEDFSKDKIELYAKDAGLFQNSKYSSVVNAMLMQSVTKTTSQNVKTVLAKATTFDSTMYKDGKVYNGLAEMIIPGLFLVLFYFVIAMFGGQMLTSTTEEKENRVIEMILTTVRAKVLIIGKIISVTILSTIQILILLAPAIAGFLILKAMGDLPPQFAMIESVISSISLDWGRIVIGALIYIASFMLFTGVLVTIGAASPTAKEANGFIGVVMMLIFGPLYAAPLFVSNPEALLVQVLGYFPLTAPIPLLLRNAVGNLELWQALLGTGILIVSAIVVLNIAVQVFRKGILEYNRKLKFKEIFSIK